MRLPKAGEPVLFASDFDGTKFHTDEIPPGGYDVNGAYQLSISENLGEEFGQAFMYQGGHNHRTAGEIVLSLCPTLDSDQLMKAAGNVNEGKLDILCGQMGTRLSDGSRWPRPTAGFSELWHETYQARESGRRIITADISAGHSRFIRKSYETHGLPQPDFLITDEVISNLNLRLPVTMQTKPAPLLMALARSLTMSLLGEEQGRIDPNSLPTLYVGDSVVKDRGLAQNSGAHFVLIERGIEHKGWDEVAAYLGVGPQEAGSIHD